MRRTLYILAQDLFRQEGVICYILATLLFVHPYFGYSLTNKTYGQRTVTAAPHLRRPLYLGNHAPSSSKEYVV